MFNFTTGKLHRVFDESLAQCTEQQQVSAHMSVCVCVHTCPCVCVRAHMAGCSPSSPLLLLLQANSLLSNMEFGRRLALERDLEKTPSFSHATAG